MLPDSISLKKVRGGDSDQFEALRSWAWNLIPAMPVGNTDKELAEEWYQEAQLILFGFVKKWRSESTRDFRYLLRKALKHGYGKFRYAHSQKLQENEIITDPDIINDNLSEIHTEDDKEYLLNLLWIRRRIQTIFSEILTELEAEILTHEFYSSLPSKDFYEAKKVSSQSYSETKIRALTKLREDSRMRDLWEQSKGIFVR